MSAKLSVILEGILKEEENKQQIDAMASIKSAEVAAFMGKLGLKSA